MKEGILFSGGVDSTIILAWKRPDVAFFVDYGQVCAKGEYRAALAISKKFNIKLCKITVSLKGLGTGCLFNSDSLETAPDKEWLPFRNQFLITICGIKCFEYDVK